MAYDFSQGYGNVNGADPLGIAVQGRGMDRRFQFAQQNPGSSFGPLPNPMWEGLFQAMQEQGVDKVADNSVGERNGMFSGGASDPRMRHFSALPSTYNPNFQQSALQGGGPMHGLQHALEPEPGAGMSHEEWMASKGRGPSHLRIQDQRGTQGLNQSQRARTPQVG